MIFGKNESVRVARPFLYNQKSSFFSLTDLTAENARSRSRSKTPTTLRDATTYQTPTKSSLARSKTITSTLSIPQAEPYWPRHLNEHLHINTLKKKQTEQLKPFFLAKSKFLMNVSRDPKIRAKRSNIIRIESIEKTPGKQEQSKVRDTLPQIKQSQEPEQEQESRNKLTEDELELVAESQGKCNEWLEKHVLLYSRSNSSFKSLKKHHI